MELLFVRAKKLSNYDATVLIISSTEKKDIVFRWKLDKHPITEAVMEYIGIGCAIKLNQRDNKYREIMVYNSEALNYWIDMKPKVDPSFTQAIIACKKMEDSMKDIKVSQHTGVIHTYKEKDIAQYGWLGVLMQKEIAMQDFVAYKQKV